MTTTVEGRADTELARSRQPLKHRLADRGIDWSLLLLLPAVLIIGGLFVYPFFYGLSISFEPLKGLSLIHI